MPRIVVTGSSGYIGSQLIQRAQARGCEIVALGSRPAGFAGEVIAWRLGDEPPVRSLEIADAVIHLGHSWTADAEHGAGPDNPNLTGAAALARATLAAQRPRFVFASTTSARREALNAYGRIKFATEDALAALPGAGAKLRCARIGLVYGGPKRAMFALMSRLAELPVLPMVALDREVQPIHVEEVCDALLRLALDPPPGRTTVVVAGPEAMTFADWLRLMRRAGGSGRLRLIPVPLQIALWACNLTRLVPMLPTVSRERVLGLAGATPMESAADLAALGITPRDPAAALAAEARPGRLRRQAAAMLRYVGGGPPSAAAVDVLARGLARDGEAPFPSLAILWPPLLRLFDPWRPNMRHRLSRQLHLAATVAESDPHAGRAPAGLRGALVQVLLDTVSLPLRFIMARFYA
jgi:NADH dehydrogenase